MKTIRIKLPSIKDVEFEIECQEEDTSFVDNCSALGEEVDKVTENWINEQLESGNYWAWCCVKMTAKYRSFEGTDYLGSCSYLSEADFIKNSGYYEDMKNNAYQDLIDQIKSLK